MSYVRDNEQVQRQFLRYIAWKFSLGGPADFPTNCDFPDQLRFHSSRIDTLSNRRNEHDFSPTLQDYKAII